MKKRYIPILMKTLFFLFTLLALLPLEGASKKNRYIQDCVVSTQQIEIEGFPLAYNPSILETDQGLLMAFRFTPDRTNQGHSYIGVVLLNDDLEPISQPELLNTRSGNPFVFSQSEDPRLFSCNGGIYVLYNDNDEVISTAEERRDMYLGKIGYANGHFFLEFTLKLFHEVAYRHQLWQKNWSPFEWKGQIRITYTAVPFEVLSPDLESGCCRPTSRSHPSIKWNFGELRGGTPAHLMDGEYLSFFHSSEVISSPASFNKKMRHYFVGAYTFTKDPPFQIKKMTPYPLVADAFYTPSDFHSRVVFPGGFVIRDNYIYMVYGKDDRESWIAKIDKTRLKKSLKPVKNKK